MISNGNKQLGQLCYGSSRLLQQFPQVTAALRPQLVPGTRISFGIGKVSSLRGVFASHSHIFGFMWVDVDSG